MHQQFRTLLLLITVCITGSSVLIFEVAAVRMLTPHFGSSLYVLSSVLTVVLAALSCGYYVGGRLADRLPYSAPLFLIIASAGATMLFLFHISQYLLPFSGQVLSVTTGPLLCALCLFFIPAFLLGIDSPFVIKLLTATSTSSTTGALVGSTFFWSTIGSIVGSLLSGFYLIPFLGITHTIIGVSLALIIWCIIAQLIMSHIFPPATELRTIEGNTLRALGLIGIISVVLTYFILSYSDVPVLEAPLYRADGYYSELYIFDATLGTTTYRFLKNDNNFSSAMIPGSNTLVFPYTQLANIYEDFSISPKNYLVLGSGAYTIPRYITRTRPDTTIDVVEIESRLYPLSVHYFELPDSPHIQNHFVDARAFLHATTTQYDVIFSDVFSSGHFIPPHLSTVEFFQELKSHLKPNGVIVLNFIGALFQPDQNLTDSMRHTITSVFPNQSLFAMTASTSPALQNLVFVMRHDTLPIAIDQNRIVTDYFNNTQTLVARNQVTTQSAQPESQIVFTDDRAPVEPLLLKQQLATKKPH